jgi:succinoglycan biosynthesis transport protein ExoP
MDDPNQSAFFGVSFDHIVWTVRKRKFTIAACSILGLVAAQLFVMLVPPKYVASSDVLFDAAAERLVSPEQELRTSWWSQQVFESATSMIASPGILKPVALKIMAQPSWRWAPTTAIEKILTNSELSGEERTRALIEKLDKDLATKTKASNILTIDYKSVNPDEAAAVANLIAATFLEQRAEARKASIAQATEWLDQRSQEAKDKLIAADKRIQEFKAQHGIQSLTGSTALEAELSRERDRLSTVRARLADTQTAYQTLQTYANEHEGNYERLAEAVAGAAMDRLRTSLLEAQGALSSAKAKLGEFHPDVVARKSQVEAVKNEIGAEARRRLLTLKTEMEQLLSREQASQEEIRSLESKISGSRNSETELLDLQREKDATKTLYDSMVSKLMQTNLQQTMDFAQFRILLDATTPKSPKLPAALILLGGVILGLSLGLIVSLVWELLQGRLVMLEQVSRNLPTKLITQAPLITKEDFNGTAEPGPNTYRSFAKQFPKSLFTNSLLAAQLAASAAGGEGKSRVIMIASPMQGNGKTCISSNLASLSVLVGARTLLIDLDARKSDGQKEIVHDGNSSRLTAFLKANGMEDVFFASRREELGDYDVLQVKGSNEAACFRFFQTQIADLIGFVRQNYDNVWIDTPPVGVFNDPLIIARHVDGVMIVAEWCKTTIKQLKNAVDAIQESGGRVLGIIMNKVSVDALISESMTSYAKYYIKKGGKTVEA